MKLLSTLATLAAFSLTLALPGCGAKQQCNLEDLGLIAQQTATAADVGLMHLQRCRKNGDDNACNQVKSKLSQIQTLQLSLAKKLQIELAVEVPPPPAPEHELPMDVPDEKPPLTPATDPTATATPPVPAPPATQPGPAQPAAPINGQPAPPPRTLPEAVKP